MKKLTVFILCMFSIGIFASPPTRTFSYESGTSINPTHVTTNEDNMYTYLQAGVDTLANNAVDTSAKITDGIILNADINSSAAIAGSKLNLAVPGAIGGTTPAAGAFTTLTGTTVDGIIGSVTPAAGVFTTITGNDTATFNESGNSNVVEIDNDGTGRCLNIVSDSTGIGMYLTQTGAAQAMVISQSSGKDSLRIFPAGIQDSGSYAIFVDSTADQDAAELVFLKQDNASSTKGLIYMQNDGSGDTILDDTGAKLTAAGDWTNAGASEVIDELDTSDYIEKLKNLKLYNYWNERERYGVPIKTETKIKDGKKVKERKYNKNNINSKSKSKKGFVVHDETTPEELIVEFEDGDIGISPQDGVNFLLGVCKELINRIEVLENM
jgi:hypothetical protein